MPGKILIADDDPNIVITLGFLMEQAGYAVDVARSGTEAVDKLGCFHPDLVLLDVLLPGAHGFELLQFIRRNTALCSTVVIVLTARGRDVEAAKCLALGANAYVTKPFSTHQLLTEVQRWMDAAHAQSQGGC